MTNRFRVFTAALAAFLCTNVLAAGTSTDGIWRDTAEASIAKGRARLIVPLAYRTLALDRTGLTRLLANAPQERDVVVARSPVHLTLPLPDGSYETFAVVDSPIMEPELAARHPEIRTWLGQSLDDPTATARIDLTPKGFHAQILGAGGTFYVDPYQPGDVDHYIAYNKRDHVHGKRGICLVTGEPVATEHTDLMPLPNLSSGGNLHTYRLAMAADGEYTMFQGGDKASALAAIVSTLNRVNGIYEREVAVRMVLVANEEDIIFTDPTTDPYANTSNDLNANQSTINSIIGSANYDIGHLVGTGGGGIAGLGVVCTGSQKAQGLTGSPAPIGDAYDVDYVAHEMGHQFGGDHTFNGSSTPAGSNCGSGNRNGGTAYEPGSGITIMAYAGICGADDTQPHSDDYFHRVSLNQILAYTTTGGGASCGTLTSTGNTPPAVTTAAGYTIPGRTPFTLTASGSDADGDPLTYVWEEFDKGATAANAGVLVDTATTGPLFRSFDPTTDPSRTFPSLRYILDNTNLVPLPNPQTAPLEGTTSPQWFIGEALPNANRTLNFQVTVRDNRAGGGGTNMASTAITIAKAAGPFAITAPNTAVNWTAGSTQNVTWNVAGTTTNGINAANVRITLSLDGGHTWPVQLAASVPNNGSASVAVPTTTPATTQARVRVEAVGNIFFDISDTDFTILASDANTAPSIAVTGTDIAVTQGGPAATANVATVSDAQDAAGSLGVSVSGAPPELAVSAQNVNGTIQFTAQAECTLVTPSPTGVKVYPVLLTVTDSGGATASAWVNVSASTNVQPTLGAYGGDYGDVYLAAGGIIDAAPDVPASDSNGNFLGTSVSPGTLSGGGSAAINGSGSVHIVTTPTTPLGIYPITASAVDSCGAERNRRFDLVVTSDDPSLTRLDTTVTGETDNYIEPNECNAATVRLRNIGGATATVVSSTLTSSTPGVTIAQANSSYADLPPGVVGNNATDYLISTDSTVACYSNISLTQTVTYAGGAGSPATFNFTLPVGAPPGDYVFAASTGGTIAPNGTRVTGSRGDEIWVNVPVPTGFSFKVYDTVVNGGTDISATENGVLMIRPADASLDSYSNGTLPSVLFGNATPALFPYWDDLDMRVASAAGSNGGIFTLLTGTAPNRVFQIEWRGVRYGGTAMLDFAVLLHENSDQFEFVYANSVDNGASATIGAQAGYTQPLYTQYSYNTANVVPAGTVLSATRLPARCNVGPGVCAVPSDIIFQDGFE
jgi:hypothetical protein